MTATHEYLADIAKRNRLRSEVSLPLLDVSTEMARLERVRDEADFDRFFQREHHRFAHLMVGRQGFMARMGMHAVIRQTLRKEWQQNRSPSD
jgi:hypothetical protein